MLKFEKVSECYEVEIPEEIFRKYMENDDLKLYRKLEEIEGVESVDYDARMGFNIFFSVETPYDSVLFEVIEQIINEHCNGELK